jgi:hypothetical protein
MRLNHTYPLPPESLKRSSYAEVVHLLDTEMSIATEREAEESRLSSWAVSFLRYFFTFSLFSSEAAPKTSGEIFSPSIAVVLLHNETKHKDATFRLYYVSILSSIIFSILSIQVIIQTLCKRDSPFRYREFKNYILSPRCQLTATPKQQECPWREAQS